ncbi:MAG TPA: MBL fold metallo-hydrolase [Acidimicrobiales bacterium]|nr:MBL fold metallo-hydrolase [Acidimicrobiales bacterium]
MIFRQYQLSCLSLFSYLIGDEGTGRAVVVDPQRDVSGYLADAAALGLGIERVIETHLHADFLSGHLEMADATGAVISYGSEAHTDFAIEPLEDGQRLVLGSVVLEVRETPGHTPESISIVVWEHSDDVEPWGVLTGDTMFIGDVGRPDLLSSTGWTADDLARRLFRSLHDRLLSLPDATRVYPAHGAGSACGKAMSDAVTSTIGEQRQTNYALQPMSEDAFVQAVTEGQSVAPLYFAFAADANRHERPLLDDQESPPALTLDETQRLMADGGVLLDARSPEAFASGHLRGAINVGLDGRFAEYAGDVVRPHQPIVVVTDGDRGTEAKVRLARIGFDAVVGELRDIETVLLDHPDAAEPARRLAAGEVAEWSAERAAVQILDVRNPGEQEAGVIAGARRIPLARLLDRLDQLDRSVPTVVYCAGGYRSSIAASLLRAHGFASVADVQGGCTAWVAAGLPVEDPTVQSPA